MSEATATTATEATEARELTPVQKIAAQYEKKDVVLCMSGANADNFVSFAETFGEGELLDWSEGSTYENPSYLIVRSENDENRMLALPSKEIALNDAVVRAKAYDWYLGKAALAAKKDDASPVLFKTPAGFFLGFDLEAFKAQSEKWVDWFKKEKKVSTMNARALRLSLSSASYAKSRFPKAPQNLWEKLIGAMSAAAEKQGQNIAIFAHWLATRELTEVDMTELAFTDDELSHVMDATAATETAAA